VRLEPDFAFEVKFIKKILNLKIILPQKQACCRIMLIIRSSDKKEKTYRKIKSFLPIKYCELK
jgi:hypothetical protein